MQDGACTFFGVDVRATVVRGGLNTRLRGVRNEEGVLLSVHKLAPVYLEMWMQIQIEYPSLPPPKSLTLSEVQTYYDFIRGDLKDRTRPRSKGKK